MIRGKSGALIFGFGVVFILLIAKLYKDYAYDARDVYLNSFEYVFSGIVFEREMLYQNGGIIRMNSVRPSLYYDPRSQYDYYYCVIQGDTSELLTAFANRFEVGDSVVVNGKLDMAVIYRNQKSVFVFDLAKLMIVEGPLAFDVKKRHKL